MILLDTLVLAWAVGNPERLSKAATSAFRRGRVAGGLAISAITLWELALLFSRGRLRSAGTIESSIQLMIDSAGVSVRPLTPTITALATQFPEDYPQDPADRIIGATARAEGLPLITRDEQIRNSRLIKTIW